MEKMCAWAQRFGLCLLASLFLCLPAAWADDFLPPEKAFVFSAISGDGQSIQLHWDVAPGYHLYKDRISVQPDRPGIELAPLAMPAAKQVFDANFNKTMAVYDQPVVVGLQFTQGEAQFQVTVRWQGCADAGLCYPPASTQLSVALTGFGAGRNLVSVLNPDAVENLASISSVRQAGVTPDASDSIASALASGSLARTMGVFWIAGVLLSFTPCVLPMVPILSSLIAGQTGPVSRSRGFGLSLAYSLGMALIYAGFGVAAGLAGEGLTASLQNPWVLGGFAAMLSTLALSMFGVYELQMPSVIQSRATEWSNRFKGGSFISVFLMGGVSALVVGPCVAAPLAGALVYISQTHDVVLGGLALFSMALGMSLPLWMVGISAGSLLPRAGAWMERVKQVFGMMLMGVAIWMVSPVIPVAVHMLLWALWLLGAATLAGLFGLTHIKAPPLIARAAATAMAACALLLLVGAASGGHSVLQPLAHLKRPAAVTRTTSTNASAATASAEEAGLKFERVTSVQALEAALTQAKAKGEAVMLDFYADWCVACKEFESFTFSDTQVKTRLNPVRLLQADVTANNADDKALLKQFGLFGPPSIVFFDGSASAKITHKVIGYQNANEFLVSLDKALAKR